MKNSIPSTPKYWILNQLNPTFNTIPKKRMGLANDPVFMEEDDFLLGDLGWIPRRNSFMNYIRGKMDIINEKYHEPFEKNNKNNKNTKKKKRQNNSKSI